MIITIDGPAGAGKSTISKKFAQQINYQVLDTGAMYRCVALLQQKHSQSLDDPIIQQEILNMNIDFTDDKIILNNQDVSNQIRIPEIDILTSQISTHQFVREHMCNMQRKFAKGKNIVAEGRDMGSNVFPYAEIKFYLTADSLVRSQRRIKQLQEKGIYKDVIELQQEIEKRDLQDMNRKVNPLCIPTEAIIIDTSYISLEKVVASMLESYNKLNI